MIRHIFLDKTTTIVKGSGANLGLNPVVELNYGDAVTRFLVHFDVSEIQLLIKDKTFAKPEKVKYTLKMRNCFAVDGLPYEKDLFYGGSAGMKQRASSFNLIAFILPREFDEGRGYEYTKDMWFENHKSFSFRGASWFQAQNGYKWDEEGVYSTETLEAAYQAFMTGDTSSIVIGRQHFDFGDEDIEFDVTDYVNKVLDGKIQNYGIGFAFSPAMETTEEDKQQYVGFFSRHTNTFFTPYIEVNYPEYIEDDRATFHIGKENKLYLYVSANGEPVNLDEMPTCEIEGVRFDTEQAQKGVYFARILPSALNLESNAIYYDKWSNLALNGQRIDDVEMEFVALPLASFFSVGVMAPKKDVLVPVFEGLNDNEVLNYGEVREVGVDFRKKYTTDKKEIVDTAFYRVYVKDGEREVEIFDGFIPVEHTFLRNFFIINTSDLMPAQYHIDFKVKQGREEHYYKDALRFKIVSDLTKRYV